MTVPCLEYLLLIFILEEYGPRLRRHVELSDDAHPRIVLYAAEYE